MAARNRSPSSQLDAFQKILTLEAAKDYTDAAVIGGLDRFLNGIGSELTALAKKRPELLGTPYASMTAAQRKQWAEAWRDLLQGSDNRTRKAPTVSPTSPSSQTSVSPKDDAPSDPPTKSKPSPSAPLESTVTQLRGVDAKTSAKLNRLGVSTIGDLLYLFPRRHNDYSKITTIAELIPGEDQTIVGTVWEARETNLGNTRLKATEAVISDESGNIRVIWFGQRYIARLLKTNTRVVISGRVEVFKGQKQFQSPEMEVLGGQENLIHTGRLVPVYPLTEGLGSRRMRNMVRQALDRWAPYIEDPLPEEIRERLNLDLLPVAVMQAHYPDSLPMLDAARRRLAFDELFILQMAVLLRRNSWQDIALGVSITPESQVLQGFLSRLPFDLTTAQDRCIKEVLGDIARDAPPMNRLLQGEVGSGKTVVALAALLAAVACGYQGSIMVPTEVLATQHFSTVSSLMQGVVSPDGEDNLITFYLPDNPQPMTVGLLTGSTKAATKREIVKRAVEGDLDILIGTHALIQEGVDMPRLALAVVDEQHRFGVSQRAALRQRGTATPHVLVMSATPIPRTLTLTIYGDLDVSIIDQLPPGRQEIQTHVVAPERRDDAYGFVRKEVLKGRQAFIICPLIEESETIEARAATEEHQRLSTQVFPDMQVELLHGRMAARQKEAVMRRFRDGDTDILVSTAVVEVGIDVPNATIMVVEGAHRFGLAQLHQFRGRVGRGQEKSYCLLLSEYSSSEARERLEAMERIHDGFELAEVDLSLRGPGDFFGTRQSGLPNLRVAGYSDRDLLQLAREEASRLLEGDPDLQQPEHQPIARTVSGLLDRVRDEVT